MTLEITTPADAERLWIAADRMRFLGGVPGSGLELVDVVVPAGSGTPPHTHESPELFYILEGELTLRQFGDGVPPKVIRAGAGTSAYIPSRAPHNYLNESGKPVRMMILLETSMITFFREIGSKEPPQGAPDFGLIGAAMARHGIEMLDVAA
jgi:quercetin dioxygenase-like cupin family protein